jgi:hypothetical protein
LPHATSIASIAIRALCVRRALARGIMQSR